MSRRAAIPGSVCALALAATVVCTAPAEAASTSEHPHHKACSNKTLKGRYAWDYNGWKADDNGTPQPFASAGHEVFNGKGKSKGTSTDSVNGKVSTAEYTAKYHIKPDCTGTYVADDGTTFRLYVERSGKAFHFIHNDEGTAATGYEVRAD